MSDAEHLAIFERIHGLTEAHNNDHKQLGEIDNKVRKTEMLLEGITRIVDDHDRILVRGNGGPDLQEQVRNVDTKVQTLIDGQMKKDERNSQFTFSILLIVIGQVATAVFAWLTRAP